MTIEHDLREASDLAVELLGHINAARDRNTNKKTSQFAFELGCAWGSCGRLGAVLKTMAGRHVYDTEVDDDA